MKHIDDSTWVPENVYLMKIEFVIIFWFFKLKFLTRVFIYIKRMGDWVLTPNLPRIQEINLVLIKFRNELRRTS
jgi:hypothetical protein